MSDPRSLFDFAVPIGALLAIAVLVLASRTVRTMLVATFRHPLTTTIITRDEQGIKVETKR